MKIFNNRRDLDSTVIDELIREIKDKNTEHIDILEEFRNAMNKFSSEKSLDSCIDALNSAMQIAKIREQLLDLYKHYSKLLENQIDKKGAK